MTLKEHLLAIAVVIVWGFNFVVIRWAIEDIHPITLTLFRFLLTAMPVVFFIKKPDVSMRYIVLYGVMFGAGLWGFVNWAVFLGIPAGLASLLLQVSAFLTVLAGVIVFKEKLTVKQGGGIFISLIGFVAICIFKSDNLNYAGILLLFLAAVFWTLCNVIIKKTKPKNVVSFTAWSSLFVPISILILTVIYSSLNGIDIGTLLQVPSTKGWIAILFQAFIITLLGYAVWTQLLSEHGLSKVALYTLLVPISGLFFGWLMYDETLAQIEIIGSLLILMGLAILSIKFTTKPQVAINK